MRTLKLHGDLKKSYRCPGTPLCPAEPHVHEDAATALRMPSYLVTVGVNAYYALDEYERDGILARIEAEKIAGQVVITRVGPDADHIVFIDDSIVVDDTVDAHPEVPQPGNDLPTFRSVSPPVNAEYLLHLCLGPADRECILGDLYEEFNEVILPRFGERRARLWYWSQVVQSLLPFLWQRVLQLAKCATIGEVAARFFRWLSG